MSYYVDQPVDNRQLGYVEDRGAEMPLVAARDVYKSYGSVPVLADVNFDILPGITGLLGSNGAGKTTLLGMILGLHPIDSGTLLVHGHNPANAGPEIRALSGYAPEHHTLPPHLKAMEFVGHVAELHGLPPSDAATRASDALWLVGLGEERFRPMGTMSTGQRQRVKLAQAIAHDPRIVLLDEPTDGLDPIQRDLMLELITHISTEFGISIVVSSHLLHEVEQVCDAVVIIGEGRTLATGRIDELRLNRPSGVELEIDATPSEVEAIAAQLTQIGFYTTSAGRKLLVDGDDRALDAIRDTLADFGVGLVRLSREKPSLEDVFLEWLG